MFDEQNIVHCCRYCKNGVQIPVKRETVCKFTGVKPSKSICRKYVFDPFKLKVKRIKSCDFSKFKPEDFKID